MQVCRYDHADNLVNKLGSLESTLCFLMFKLPVAFFNVRTRNNTIQNITVIPIKVI